MEYAYLRRTVEDSSINVEDPGNCAIVACNDVADYYILVVETYLGWTNVLTYGPLNTDIMHQPLNVSMLYNRFQFDKEKINKAIDKFLNNPKGLITSAEEVDIEDAIGMIPSAREVMSHD